MVVGSEEMRVGHNRTVINIGQALAEVDPKFAPKVFDGTSPYEGPTGRIVIVITGHVNERLAAFVRKLGELGYLKGNFVVFNSCEQELTKELIVEMSERFGAVAVFSHQGKILGDELRPYLLEFAKRVKQGGRPILPRLLLDVLELVKKSGFWVICDSRAACVLTPA